MRYLTDRKRAEGKGAAHTGTAHHWYMQVTAVGLAVLIPFFVYVFGKALGGSHAEVLAVFAHPFVAVLSGLVLVVSMGHFAKGAQMMIEDYAHGETKKLLVILAISISYAVMAVGLFALAKIAL